MVPHAWAYRRRCMARVLGRPPSIPISEGDFRERSSVMRSKVFRVMPGIIAWKMPRGFRVRCILGWMREREDYLAERQPLV